MLFAGGRPVSAQITTFPYFQDFEASNGSFTHAIYGSVDDWAWGHPTAGVSAAHSGQKCWATNLTGSYNNNNDCALITPSMNFSTLTHPVVTFWMAYESEVYWDGMIIEASSNGGSSWSQLSPYDPPYTQTSGYSWPGLHYGGSYLTWQKYIFQMSAYAGYSNVQFRWHFKSDGSVTYYGFYVDDFAVGDFSQKDIKVVSAEYPNATGFWARKVNESHSIIAHIQNLGFEKDPTNVTLTYKLGTAPTTVNDGTSETFTPNWSNGTADCVFSIPQVPTSTGPVTVFIRAFYPGDQDPTNDMASTSVVIQPKEVFGFEDFDSGPPPAFQNGWTVVNNGGPTTWTVVAANGYNGTNAAAFPGDVPADDWLVSPAAMLGAGSSYSLKFKYRSLQGLPQTLDIAWGPSPDPTTMTVFGTFSNFTNTSFVDAKDGQGMDPSFNTPNTAQNYYIAFHAKDLSLLETDIDEVKLIENPTPPPKIAYGIPPTYIDDPTIPITFSGVYKKTGLLTRTYTVINATGKYGNPPGDFLWDVNTTDTWFTLTKSTPDPLSYLTVNPFNPPWCRQFQTFTITVDASKANPGTVTGSITFDGYLWNVDYPRGIHASNALFVVPVVLNLTAAGGVGTASNASATMSNLTQGNSYDFADPSNNVFATVHVTQGSISSLKITSYPSQLPRYLSRYHYVKHYWTMESTGSGWMADVDFHYFDSEVLAGGVTDEWNLAGTRVPPGTAYWEYPIVGTGSLPNPLMNYVTVSNLNAGNSTGMIALAEPWNTQYNEKNGIDASPTQFSLEQNYPNPFNPSTEIMFALPTDQFVTLTVTNSLGQEVARLVNGIQSAGYHTVQFDGSQLSSGAYTYTLKAGDFTQSKVMVLNK
jgi:hypothetical protein